ncbi:hypothetical protein SY94_1097 [Agrobacterium tumefaciens]|nr:hypothetical protein SY94_1097 [Agrobacterium tumefaciens]
MRRLWLAGSSPAAGTSYLLRPLCASTGRAGFFLGHCLFVHTLDLKASIRFLIDRIFCIDVAEQFRDECLAVSCEEYQTTPGFPRVDDSFHKVQPRLPEAMEF